MDSVDIAIEGYNKEKFEIQKELIGLGQWAHESKYDCFRDRTEQIDRNIERLLGYNFYPTNQ